MSFRLVVRPSAKRDIAEADAYYAPHGGETATLTWNVDKLEALRPPLNALRHPHSEECMNEPLIAARELQGSERPVPSRSC